MKIIFAIGNPGTQYSRTRHNAGVIFCEWVLAKTKPISTYKSTRYVAYALPNEKFICFSHTYMNLSGKAIESFAKKHLQATPADFIIVHDDLEHKVGNVRIKVGGSTGGHNGVDSVAASLKSKDFKRLQIGIDRPASREPEVVAKYVLSQFGASEMEAMKNSFGKGLALLQQHQFL